MQIKLSLTIVACLGIPLGMTLATAPGAASKAALPAHDAHRHHNHHRGLGQLGSSMLDHDTEQKMQRDLPQPPNGPVHRCHDPAPEQFGPAPPVEDCNDVIQKFAALTTDINVKLVEGCYQIVSGNCTGLVCPQRIGESTIPGSVAAQYMASPVRDECIAKGQRGWWIDGQGWGIGVYLT